MKLLLIQAWNAKESSYRGKFSNLISYPSLTLAALYALIPTDRFECVDIVDESSQHVDYRKKYDLVLISFDTSSALSAYRHCRAYKKRGAYVACGGYHATALPNEVLHFCDTVIKGPAEKALPAFLADFLNGSPKKIYENRNICPADFPIPARDRITGKNKLHIPGIIANHGCGNNCKYCSMRTMWKNEPRPVGDVIRELKSLHSKTVIFYDPNLFGDREYALKLMKAMKPLKMRWATNATADFGFDHELMHAAYEAGCRGVLIGMESLSTESLRLAAKRFTAADRYKAMIRNLHSHGIAVNGCFVLGFDSDTASDIAALPRKIDELGLDLCRFAILTPYPGTRFYDEFEKQGRILTKDWSLYTQKNAVFQPREMTPVQLEILCRKVWRETYSWKRIFRRVLRSPLLLTPYAPIVLGANIGFKFLEKR